MGAGSVSVAANGTVTKTGLAGDIYDQRVISLALADPPGQIADGPAGVPIKQGIALDANALSAAIFGASTGVLPAGAVVPYAGATVPTGYLFADGSAVSRATYAALFVAIGVTYGVGDGATTFNLPDLRARVPIGTNTASLPNGENGAFLTRALAATGGAESHTLGTSEIPAHAHGSAGLVHSTPGAGTLTIAAGLDFDLGGATGNLGGSLPHNNMQPFLALNWIVKT